ncbi:MbtH family NRPS accessory protein, partial [Kitasatospora sp. NPDC059571]
GRHSLWPSFVDVPAGWTAVRPAGTRQECLEHVARHWTDAPSPLPAAAA